MKIHYTFFKNCSDKAFALIALITFSPLLLIISIISFYKLGKPVLFTQWRPGLKGKKFKLIKFRTMHQYKDTKGNLLEDNKRKNKFGNFLRSTSLDELPEILNILKGEMSFVGPRPLLIEYLHLYSDEQMKRHDVKPGITGFAQINGRNAISWKKKFQYDLWYVNNHSFIVDVKIILITIKRVILRNGINQSTEVTMSKFKGSIEDT